MKSKALLVFRKNLVLGQVKTRIAQDSNPEIALEIYQSLCLKVEKVVDELDLDVFMFYSDQVPENSKYPNTQIQKGNDLGERMSNAFNDIFQNYNSAILIGTDCPYITTDDINFAFKVLETNDLVIGPALDGGYYLIGMNHTNDYLFQEIPWSTSSVLKRTIDKIQSKKLHCYQLIPYSDIDQLQDWYKYKNNLMY